MTYEVAENYSGPVGGNQVGPPPGAPEYMGGTHAPAPERTIGGVSSPNKVAFVLDQGTIKILNEVHPQMVDTMVALAIKKFAESTDFINYFVQEVYRETAEIEQQSKVQVQEKQTPAQEAPKAAVSFDSW